MNKRIKKKVTKRAIQKYHNGEQLTHKEYKLIDTYIFINEFDMNEFTETFSKVFSNVCNALADGFESLAKAFRVKIEVDSEEQPHE